MSINLKPSNQFKKVKIIEIVFMQGDNFYQAMTELNNYYSFNGDDSTDKEKIDYLLQWYQDNDIFYQSASYNAKHINTPFLGKLIKIQGYKGYFLYTINRRLDYMGLSKIISIE